MQKKIGWAILIIDIENAFNTADRNLILRLAAAHIPEAVKLFWWLYHLETILVTSSGDEVLNSAGVQQGCPMASLAFALIIKWIVEQLNHKGLAHKLFFHDDGLLAVTPGSLGWAAKFIDELSPVSGLKIKWSKTECHAPGPGIASQCRVELPIGVVVEENLDFNFLKAPIGSDGWVKRQLQAKLEELRKQIELISRMPFRHEAFTLLKHCASICKIKHLLRTLPPIQLPLISW